MTFALQASAKPLILAAGALVVAFCLSSPALAHEEPQAPYGKRQAYDPGPYGGFDGRGADLRRVGPEGDEALQRERRIRAEHAREVHFKKRKHHKLKHKQHADLYVPHDHDSWRHGHRHGRRHAQAFPAPGANCHPVQQIEYYRGRPARVGGVGCYDAHGHFRLLPRSRYLIHYIAY